jgi:hypothetical protein
MNHGLKNSLIFVHYTANYIDESKKKSDIYFVSLFSTEMNYMIQGETYDSSGEAINEIKKLSSSFKED